MKTAMILETQHLPRFIKTQEKCTAMENGYRCKQIAEVEMVYYGDGKVSQVVVKLCNDHAKVHDETSYYDLNHEIPEDE